MIASSPSSQRLRLAPIQEVPGSVVDSTRKNRSVIGKEPQNTINRSLLTSVHNTARRSKILNSEIPSRNSETPVRIARKPSLQNIVPRTSSRSIAAGIAKRPSLQNIAPRASSRSIAMDAKVALAAVPVKERAAYHSELASAKDEPKKVFVRLVAHEDKTTKHGIVAKSLEETTNHTIVADEDESGKEKEQARDSPVSQLAEPLAKCQIAQLVVSQEIATIDSPSEISAELTPSEGTSSEPPAKPSGIATCLQGCFKWMPSRRL